MSKAAASMPSTHIQERSLAICEMSEETPIEIDGLWALSFGTDKFANGKTNQLFFTAGPSFPPDTTEYADGLFGGR
jgi:hypothetical protein